MDVEHNLIQRCINGDNKAFERLVVRYEQRIMRFLRLKCSVQSDADDIFQETFINMHRYINTYDPAYPFSSWLFKIAINALNKYYKKLEAFDELNTECVLQEHSTADNIWRVAKQTLPPSQLNLLWLTYAEGYTGKETASIMEKSLPWIKINLVRAKHQLRQALRHDTAPLSDWIN